ncbi:hypothetical protein 40R [Ranavirus ambystoma1]|uniref:Uncharacterized protein n=1 Tax=Ranavirus ambystoma1 TaxID=265294 RepID=A0A0U2RPJ6_9VIRU|nr:hypothetical protein 40R [Ambystoma tigrinum virus]
MPFYICSDPDPRRAVRDPRFTVPDPEPPPDPAHPLDDTDNVVTAFPKFKPYRFLVYNPWDPIFLSMFGRAGRNGVKGPRGRRRSPGPPGGSSMTPPGDDGDQGPRGPGEQRDRPDQMDPLVHPVTSVRLGPWERLGLRGRGESGVLRETLELWAGQEGLILRVREDPRDQWETWDRQGPEDMQERPDSWPHSRWT